ncbi:MAG TPA: hypothetical protein VFT57_00350 [Gemmatimonadaceae bacterium]|nr:hypothetical protein [Gemmatimonadaceae bacterium]
MTGAAPMTEAKPGPARPPMAPTPGGMTPAANSIRLAGENFAASILYLLAGAAGLVWIAPELAIGAYPSPHVAGITHLFTLGWITTTIFGALAQLLPVALGAPIRSTRVGHASFFTFAPGVGFFAAGIAASSLAIQHTGIALITVGIVLEVGNIAASLPRAKNRDVTWGAVTIAISYLASTLVLGVILLHNLHSGFIANARLTTLATHLHVALVGWVLMMIVGVSHRLLPMFLLAHGADTRWTKRSLVLLSVGVLVLATGLVAHLAPSVWLGAALIDCGIGAFIWQAYSFYRVRVRKKLDVGLRFAMTGIVFLAVAAVLGSALVVLGPMHARLATMYIVVGLLGGIVLYVVGFFYKIVPLLAWTARFRGRMGKGPVPTVAQLYSAKVAYIQLGVMTLAVVLLASGVGAGITHLTRCGAVLFLAGVVLFISQRARVAFGGRT